MTQHWLGKDPPQLTAAVRAAREAVAGPEAVQRLRAGLDAKLAGAAAPQLTAAPVSKLAGGKLLALLIAGAGALYLALPEPAPQPRPPTPRSAAPAAAVAEPALLPVESQPSLAAEPTKNAASAPAPTAPARARTTAASQRVAVRAPERERKANLQPQPTAADPGAEVALISRAQQQLRAQPAQALALLDEHAHRFPSGILAQERDALRIDAERALGQIERARAHAHAFVASYPDSQELRALQRWLASQPSAATDHKTVSEPVPTP